MYETINKDLNLIIRSKICKLKKKKFGERWFIVDDVQIVKKMMFEIIKEFLN